MLRRLGAVVALAGCVALLGGCVAYKSISVSQDGGVGAAARIQVVLCVNEIGSPQQHAGCSFNTNRPFEAANDDYQVLLAFRLPVGATAPESFAATAGEALTFTRSSSYEGELARLAPPPAGQFWAGYLSTVYSLAYAGMEPARESTVAPEFGLPLLADGAPFQGPFTYMPVVGGREVGDTNEPTATDPVSCGDVVNNDPTACIDYPQTGFYDTSYSFFTRDFGVIPGKATASPGQTVSLPFGVRGVGAIPAGVTATLSASTTLPGAGTTPTPASVTLAGGADARASVPVTIPAATPPGVFDVALTARLDNGQVRTAKAQLTVRDRQKPVVSKLAVKPKSFKAATKRKPKRGTSVSYTLSEAASVRVVVERCSKYAKLKKRKAKKSAKSVKPKRGRCLRYAAMSGATTQTGKAGANGFRFNGKVAGRALKPGPYRLVLTATDGAANAGDKVRVAFAIRR